MGNRRSYWISEIKVSLLGLVGVAAVVLVAIFTSIITVRYELLHVIFISWAVLMIAIGLFAFFLVCNMLGHFIFRWLSIDPYE